MTNVFYFGQAQTVGLTIFGIVGGIIMRFTRRYKVRIALRATGVTSLNCFAAAPRHRSLHSPAVSPM